MTVFFSGTQAYRFLKRTSKLASISRIIQYQNLLSTALIDWIMDIFFMNSAASSLDPQVAPGVATVVSPQFFEHPWDLLISGKDVFILWYPVSRYPIEIQSE